ncbi:hypothetical protein O181_072797 [Austropuccinia psidii MF-1]|uniref:Uncharacterized protein n=1 Tax=Austropuccinia psidii MF-1 TaxID=1389203 RepID=A0A9Q3IAG2_9BASI|nr:hypothetical protein [Austropuccinia psidii MF-1]
MPLDGNPVVPQLRTNLGKGQVPSRKEGRGPRRSRHFSEAVDSFPEMSKITFKGLRKDGEEEGEGSNGTEVFSAPVGASEGFEGPTVAQSKYPE